MYRLLIVDDEPLVCVGVQSMLNWATLEIEIVGVARNGQHAAEIIENQRPDIVISDIKMPIKNGLQLAKECSEKYGRLPVFIMLTSYDDFQYARQALQAQAIDYLIKLELDAPTLERSIRNALKVVCKHKDETPPRHVLVRSNMQTLREKFFIRLFNNLFNAEDMYHLQKTDLGIDLTGEGFVVASCEIIVPSDHTSIGSSQITLYSSVMQLVRETLPKYLPCHIISLDMWHFAVVFCLDETSVDYKAPLHEALTQTFKLMNSFLRVFVHAALGNMVEDARNLDISYRQSQCCIHGMTNAEPVVFCEASISADTSHIVEIQAFRKNIRKAFEEIDTVALNETLTAITDAYVRHPDSLLEIMDTTCNILYMAISLLPEGEHLLEQIFNDSTEGYRALYRLRDVDSIAAWVRQLRDGCNDLLQSRRQNYKENVVASVKSYIVENLDKHLSLHAVAAVFNFNPNYLSQLFSKYAGEGFVEYITNKRISVAKDLLARGEMKVYEIAEHLGFESSFYFSKVFKKVEGVSPREYVQKLNAFHSDEANSEK